MKKLICMGFCLLALLFPLCVAAQEYYTLPEIREQAAQGWHETVTDRYGRETTVDVDVQVFGEENAPVVRIRPSEPMPKCRSETKRDTAEGSSTVSSRQFT